jgi:hypothetical protein
MGRFCKIGNLIINVDMITHIEIYESGESIKVFFSGSESLRINQPEAKVLLDEIGASERKSTTN